MSINKEEDHHKQIDFYEILGIPRNAAQEEIKKSYNELVLLYHPDKGGDPQKFKDLQIAYKVLSNEKSRKVYTDALASTFTDIKQEYRDQPKAYEQTVNDFNIGTKEEKERKKESFMKQFEDSRTVADREVIVKMNKEVDVKNKQAEEMKNHLPTYRELLQQQEQDFKPPAISALMTEKFDVNLFNQIFEQNKQKQTKDLEPYQNVQEVSRTDLAFIDDSNTFMNQRIESNQDFFTYQNPKDVDIKQYDPNHNVTLTRDMVFDDVNKLVEKRTNERFTFEQSMRVDPPPTTVKDDHQLSYQQMGLNGSEL
jgi:curved DNA-binding protein CbpA